MSAISSLSKLRELGITLQLKEENLKLIGPEEKLTPSLIDELKKNKEAIISFLKGNLTKKLKFESIEPVEKKEYYAASSAQKRMYILQQIGDRETDNIAYNIPSIFKMKGDINIDKIKRIFHQLISRHESLRTSIKVVADYPFQVVDEDVDFDIEYHELGPGETGRGNSLPTAGMIIKNFIRSFDLSRAPLFRVGLVKTGVNDYVLIVDMHHIISDGLSHRILKSDFQALYEGKNLEQLRIQYKDYSEWLDREKEGHVLKRQEEYWLNRFQGEIPVLDLPADFPRPVVQSFEGKSIGFEIDQSIGGQLNKIVTSEGVTLFMVLLAIYNVFLAKISGQSDIVVGTPIAGRKHADMENIIGIFVNTLAFRNYPTTDNSFEEFLKKVKESTFQAFENQEYQFEDLVERVIIERDMSRNALFDALFELQDIFEPPGNIPGKEASGVEIQPYSYENKIAQFDLTLSAIHRNGTLYFSMEYCTKLFRDETIVRFIQYFERILLSVIENPGKKISDIEVMGKEEKEKILNAFNDTRAPYPKDNSICRLFEEQVEKTPWKTAVVDGESQLAYHELNRRANRLAGTLKRKGVKPEKLVGIMIERSQRVTIAVMAVLKAGGAYLPLDPSYPAKRIDYMIQNSGVTLLLVEDSFIHTGEPAFLGEIVDICAEGSEAGEAGHLESVNIPGNLAYVIYTSGSTGKPKGVMVQNDQYVNAAHAWKEAYRLAEIEVNLLQMAAFSFDVFGGDMARSLLNGGKMVICPDNVKPDLVLLHRLILNQKISLFEATPALIVPLMDYVYENQLETGCLSLLILGADICPLEDFKKLLLRFAKKMRIINSYGVTEATIDTTFYEISGSGLPLTRSVPIGKPLPNMKVYIVDTGGKLQPVGVSGELYIGGRGIARGYLNSQEMSRERFLPDPFKPGEGVYKTGDRARWLSDGNVEFLGRIDQQVKIRGYRIELGEIENQLAKYPGIKETVVLSREDKIGDAYLCAYMIYEPLTAKSIEIQSLKEYLSGLLPEYMLPSHFVAVDKIPLTPNGKIDRKALPTPEIKDNKEYVAPGNFIEEKLAEIWSQVLGLEKDKIGIESNFFEIGGHSLRATVLISKIHKELNVKIPLTEVFKGPNIRSLSKYIEASELITYTAIEAVEEREYYPLSSAQKRLFFLQEFDLNSTGYNMAFVVPLGKGVEKDKLEFTLRQLIGRHESLRTSFERVNEDVVQRVHKLETVEFSLDYCEAGITEAEKVIRQFTRPFDLSKPPLIRSGIIRLPDRHHMWMVDMHHIVSDGTSHTVLTEDFVSLYNGVELGPLPIQYKDFTQWQNRLFESGEIESQKKYWLQLYNGEIPRLDLAADYKRPEVFTFQGDHYRFSLDTENTEKLKILGSRYGGTLYMNMLAVINTLFYKYTGQTDIIIGSGIAGRRHDDLQGIVGMFVNALAMRNYPGGEKSYEGFLKEVIKNSLKSFENQDLQFEELVEELEVERDPSRNPLFDISMVVQNFRKEGELNLGEEGVTRDDLLPEPDQDFSSIEDRNTTTKFDMTFFVHEYGENVVMDIEYYTCLFKLETIQRMVSHFKNVIKAVVKDPSQKLKNIEVISGKEKRQVLYEFNNTTREYPKNKTLQVLFEEQVEKTPGHAALIYNDQVLTYKQLDRQANQMARYLYSGKGIQPGKEDRVGILMSEPLDRLTAVLGILKAGGAYVPIDPLLPEDRIKYMIHDSSTRIVISEKKYLRTLNRLLWECHDFHSYLCMDSIDIHMEDEVEENPLMDEELWQYVGEEAVDEIEGGGWYSSYTGEKISREEMDEYGDNILTKLEPILHPRMRILELGCASGISMFRLAPRVGLYYGTDLSSVIIDKNRKKIEREGHRNIKLSCAAAHEIHKIEESDFELIIMNSVIQNFPGHNYLRKSIRESIDLLGEKGYLFIGDIMDHEKKDALIRDLFDFKYSNKDKNYTTKTDFSAELFVSKGYWEDLEAEFQEIEKIEFSGKIHSIENELTKFRYDALIFINKQSPSSKNKSKRKYREDGRSMSLFGTERLPVSVPPTDPAYIIYTSGTTGKPKGVMIEHRSVVNLIISQNATFRVNESDRILQFSSLSFDASVEQIWLALLSGAGLVLVDRDTVLDSEAFETYIAGRSVTHLHTVPQFLNTVELKSTRGMRRVLAGGDICPASLAAKWYNHCEFYNRYGPTETAVTVAEYLVKDISDNQTAIPIGRPMSNIQAYILDKYNNICPVGVVGQLFIGGDCLSRGYLNNPELTAEKFVDFSGQTNVFPAVLYKTGDLALWRPDGNIEFSGRIDFQVKIRGFRIELAEIESRLLKYGLIEDAVVIDRTDEKGEKYLAAYIVSSKTFDNTELRDLLSQTLPDYMIPSYFIPLEAIPLTSNGKIDRKALPGPEAVYMEAGKYAAPRGKIEKKLVKIWNDVLGVSASIGIDDNFFELGGHSLKATALVSKIHKELNVKIPLAEIFKRQTIRDLSVCIGESQKVKYASICPVEKKEYHPASPAQKRIYILQQITFDNTSYNMPYVIPLSGYIDNAKLESVFKTLVARHESLRTSFEMLGDELVQKIHQEVDISIREYNASEVEADRVISNFTGPFDLSKAPLLRVGLLTIGAGRQILLTDMHHIITDGTSQNILKKEFKSLYEDEELTPLKLQYKDYSRWQNDEAKQILVKESGNYWLNIFAGDVPVLNLPIDYSRPLDQSFEGYTVNFQLTVNETYILKTLSKEADVTLYMYILSLFTILLSKLSGQEDIIVGTPISGRRHTDLERIIGMFVNTIALRIQSSGKKRFGEFLNEVKERTVEAYENQEFQFEELVDKLSLKRDTGRNPLFDVMFNFMNKEEFTDDIPEIDEEGPHLYTHFDGTSKFDMTLTAIDLGERLFLSFEYCAKLFKPDSIERFISYFKRILNLLLENRDRKLSEIEIITDQEKRRILYDFNDTEAEFPRGKTIHGLFEEQVKRTPDKIAVNDPSSSLRSAQVTYRELNKKSNRLAGYLLSKLFIRRDMLVGILMERSEKMVESILAVWKSGGAYIPLDTKDPLGRVDSILYDSRAAAVITENTVIAKNVRRFSKRDIPIVCLEELTKKLKEEKPANPGVTIGERDLAYVIYTSGSTGKPKGAMVEHVGMMNHMYSKIKDLELDTGSVIAQNASHCFDISVWQFFAALVVGGTTVIYNRDLVLNTKKLIHRIDNDGITVLEMVPSHLSVLLDTLDEENTYPSSLFRCMQYLMTTGETIKPVLVNRWFERFRDIRIVNAYGPTEASDDITHYIMVGPQDTDTIPLGTSLPNLSIYIVDKELHLCPVGIKGEILVSGIGVGRGYLNDVNKTHDSFMNDPFREEPGIRMYKTGDIGRYLEDGRIEFFGRKDYQLKIRGFRIELGEIESRLAEYPGIKEAVVTAKIDGDKYLCAYFVPGNDIPISELREYLLTYLPGYMIPSYFIPLDKLPLTPNGKIDRKALPAPEIENNEGYAAPGNLIEEKLAVIWSRVLEIEKDKIGMESNFFEIGGHSLKATIVTSKIHKELNVKMPLTVIFKSPTIRSLSRYIEAAGKTVFTAIEPVEAREYYVLSSAQKRLYFLQQFDLNNTTYNMPFILPLGKELEKDKLEFTLKQLIGRHESLRTSFKRVHEEVVQEIHEMAGIEFALDYFEADITDAEEVIRKFIRPFDLSKAPLLRSGIIRFPDGHHVWMVDVHHIVSDGVSNTVLTEDFMSLYNGEVPEPLYIQYKDFAQWQNRLFEIGEIKAQEDYWLDLYSGEIPRLSLVTDYKRPNVFTFEGEHYIFELDGEDAEEFKTLGSRGGGTLYMNMSAVLNTLFYKYTGQTDIIIGSGTAGRRHADLQGVVGMFVNILPMRNYPRGEKSYENFLQEVITNSVKGFENQDVQLEYMVDRLNLERETARNPLFDISLVVQNFNKVGEGPTKEENSNIAPVEPLPGADTNLPPVAFNKGTSKFDMTFFVSETRESVQIDIEYYRAVFKPETIRRLASHFKNAVRAVARDPFIKLKDVDVISDEEKRRVLSEFNDTGSDYPKDKTIHKLFKEQIERTPDKVALVCDGQMLTYKEFESRSDRLARYYSETVVQQGDRVGILMDPTLYRPVSILGILIAGSAYVPIDPSLPLERIKYMINDAHIGAVISEKKYIETLNRLRRECDCFCRYLCIDTLDIHGEDYEERNEPVNETASSDLAYIIYTSGTTGRPKGVMVEHRSLVNLCHWHNRYYRVTRADSATLYAGFVFDASVWELFPYLIKGSCIHLIDDSIKLDVEKLNTYYEQHNITVSFLPTQFCEQFMELENRSLRLLLTGGDKLRKFIKRRYELYNNYGPTENTVVASAYPVDSESDNIPIGKPVDNTTVYIVNKENLLPRPLGAAGELCISGDSLARGYLNQPELTAEKFSRVTAPLTPLPLYPSAPLYRTGDRARWLPDGNIEFFGRIDQQVKVRGFRIEPGEIETRLMAVEDIREAVVIDRTHAKGDTYLTAYIVSTIPFDKTGLKNILSQSLPDYMIPSYFVSLEAIPLTPNGKIDRKALPAPEIKADEGYIAPGNLLEEKLSEIWAEILGIEKDVISINSNFFDLGGHSLKATTLISGIHKELSVKVPLAEMFKSPTIMGLSEFIVKSGVDNYTTIEATEKKEYYPLSSVQKRMYFVQKMQAESKSYNLPTVVTLEGETDYERLNNTFQQLLNRHEALRTSFVVMEEEAVQVIHKGLGFMIEYYVSEEENAQEIVGDFLIPFDLSRAPLLRVGLIRLSEARHILMLDMHHIISDGISYNILISELSALYLGNNLPPLKIQYKDFSQWQNRLIESGEMVGQKEYWLNLFGDGNIPVLSMPLDYPRPAVRDIDAGDSVGFSLDETLCEKIYLVMKKTRTTLSMILLSVFNLLLNHYTKQEDIVVGIVNTGRKHPDLQNVIGMFVNTIPLRNYPQRDKTFGEFLKEVKGNLLSALENQDYPFDELVIDLGLQGETTRNALFDVAFNLNNIEKTKVEHTDLKIKTYNNENEFAKFDLTVYANEHNERINIVYRYSTQLFKRSTIEQLKQYYMEIIEHVVENENIKLKDIALSHDFLIPQPKVGSAEDDEFRL